MSLVLSEEVEDLGSRWVQEWAEVEKSGARGVGIVICLVLEQSSPRSVGSIERVRLRDLRNGKIPSPVCCSRTVDYFDLNSLFVLCQSAIIVTFLTVPLAAYSLSVA